MMKRCALVCALALFPLLSAQQVADNEQPTRDAELPTEEVHIRTGMMLLSTLYNTLAKVKDRETAQASVPGVVRLTRELHAWGQAMNTLPPLSEPDREMYETRYLPAIRRLNEHLRAQGERLAASEYFGSQDLAVSLISLYVTTQQ